MFLLAQSIICAKTPYISLLMVFWGNLLGVQRFLLFVFLIVLVAGHLAGCSTATSLGKFIDDI